METISNQTKLIKTSQLIVILVGCDVGGVYHGNATKWTAREKCQTCTCLVSTFNIFQQVFKLFLFCKTTKYLNISHSLNYHIFRQHNVYQHLLFYVKLVHCHYSQATKQKEMKLGLTHNKINEIRSLNLVSYSASARSGALWSHLMQLC